MTDYLGSLNQLSAHTQITFEDLLESGHRVDFDVSVNVIISRPNKLRAERKGELVDQVFYYDSKTLTLYNPSEKVYATEAALGTIERLLDYMRESLGLIVPVTLTLLTNRINDMRNPDFLDMPHTEADPRFQRFVELNTELDQAGVLHWLADPEKDRHFDIFITSYAPVYSKKVNEYLTLLGLPMPKDQSKNIVLPVYFGVKGQELAGIAISTRSTFS